MSVNRRVTAGLPTIQELSGRLHFLVSRALRDQREALLIDHIRFRLVNKPGCRHDKDWRVRSLNHRYRNVIKLSSSGFGNGGIALVSTVTLI